MTDQERKQLRDSLSPEARKGFDFIQAMVDEMRRKEKLDEINAKNKAINEFKQIMRARKEALKHRSNDNS